jgi:hypothetical protein
MIQVLLRFNLLYFKTKNAPGYGALIGELGSFQSVSDGTNAITELHTTRQFI